MPPKPFSLAVNAVIIDTQNRCLLIRRSASSKHFVGCWEWPGGKLDPGEDFVAALHREVAEETGLTIELSGFAGSTTFEMPSVNVILLCLEARMFSGSLRLSEEHDDAAWTPLDRLSQLELPDSIGPFMLEYAAKKRIRP
jgi:8-oxo-dGTP diphosphatase